MIDEFIIYWKTEHGPEYNISTGSNQTEYHLYDKITSATWYYISLVAVAGEETSNRSDMLRTLRGKFIINIYIYVTHLHKISHIAHFSENEIYKYLEREQTLSKQTVTFIETN